MGLLLKRLGEFDNQEKGLVAVLREMRNLASMPRQMWRGIEAKHELTLGCVRSP